MQPGKDNYLSLLGIELWCRKPPISQPYLYESRHYSDFTVSLLTDFELNGQSAGAELVAEILTSLELTLLGQAQSLTSENLDQLQNAKYILNFVGPTLNIAKNYGAHLSPKIIHSEPKQLLAFPLKKRELWANLRNFT
ncbi:MAG: hypothetical protein H0U71_04245 [Gammaproteobacteria bacterium]|nr:hypothetical protein [Gammaproteobacteria bacterium]